MAAIRRPGEPRKPGPGQHAAGRPSPEGDQAGPPSASQPGRDEPSTHRPGGGRDETTARARLSWGAERVRRPADLFAAIVALVVAAIVIGSIKTLPLGSTEAADYVSRGLDHFPRWLASAAAVVAGTGSFVFVIVAVVQLARSQWRDARNTGAALVAGAAAAIAAVSVWDAEHAALQAAVLHGKNPAWFVIDTAFVSFVAGTDLARRPRWSRWCVGLSAALLITGTAVNMLTPFALVLALFGGLGVGWLVRWGLGAASVAPSPAELVPWLIDRGVPVAELAPNKRDGRIRLEGRLADGTPVEVQLADRDTRGSGLAQRLWSLVRLRPGAAGHIALTSRVQIERLALASTLAQRNGVLCPGVLLLDETPRESLVLALASPPGGRPDGALTRQSARSLFTALRRLHDAGVAHRDLRPGHLCLAETPAGNTGGNTAGNAGRSTAGFSSLDSAAPAAGELARRVDIAQLLVTLAGSVGPGAAVSALREGYGPVDEASVAAVLQPVALAPWGWRAMRQTQACLNEVRHELLGPGAAVPPARLERFRWRTVLSTVALIAAAYILLGEISKVNLLGMLGSVNPGWFAVAVAASAMTYFAAAQNLAAFVPKHLSPVRGFLVQLATAFVGVAMPPTVGHVAVNARYLHRENVDGGSISAAVALSQLVNVITTVLLLVVIGLLTGSGLSRFKIAPGGNLLLGLVIIAAVIAVLLAVPKTRGKLIGLVWPHLRRAWPRLLDAVSQPARLAWSAAANLLLTVCYLVAFMTALRAVGAHPAILPAAVVFLAGNTVGSAAPTPGGLGGVEAVLVAGLTAMGIPAAQAISGVLVFRVATFWLPIPAGWVAYLKLQRDGTL